MAARRASPAFDYVIKQLEGNPQISFPDIRALGAEAGFKILPIVYGRAKALLGLVPVSPRGTKKAAKKAAKQAAARKPRPAATTRAKHPAAPASPMDSLEAVIAGMKASEKERASYRQALEEIAEIIRRVL